MTRFGFKGNFAAKEAMKMVEHNAANPGGALRGDRPPGAALPETESVTSSKGSKKGKKKKKGKGTKGKKKKK